mgnify:CR=1 FL=1
MVDEFFSQIRDSKLRYRDLLSKKGRHKCFMTSCKNNAIASHSISRGLLEKIAENGHIVSATFDICNIGSNIKELDNPNGPNLAIKEIGINKAGVFKGFCQNHDNEVFNTLDNFGISTQRDIFLQLYRTVCKYKFLNDMLTKSEKDVFGYEYYSNTEFEKSLDVSLEYIMIFLEDMLIDFPELALKVNIGFDEVLTIKPWNKKFESKFIIGYKKLKPDFNFALENDLTLHFEQKYHHCIVILIPGSNYSSLMSLSHPDILPQLNSHWSTDIDLLNFFESILIQDAQFYLPPSVQKKWTSEKLKVITDDYFFINERKFLQEYDVSIFDDLRKKISNNCPEDIKQHEFEKISTLPYREPFIERYRRMTPALIKVRQDKIRKLGFTPNGCYPIGSLIIK